MTLSQSDFAFVALGLLLGSIGVGLGISIRLGGSRRFLRSYFLPDLPGYIRNVGFALIPMGLMFALGMLGVLLEATYGTRALALIAVVFALDAVAVVVTFWWLFLPPEFAMPAWLRAEEAAGRAGLPVPDHRPPRPSPAQYTAGWVITALLLPVGLAFGVPFPPLLMGVGIGASMLLANPPWARGDDFRRSAQDAQHTAR